MAGELARRCHHAAPRRRPGPSIGAVRNGTPAFAGVDVLEIGIGDRAGPQNPADPLTIVDSSPALGRPVVDHQRDPPAQACQHMLGARRADRAAGIGGRRGERLAGRREQARASRGARARAARSSPAPPSPARRSGAGPQRQHQRQRPRPERRRQRARRRHRTPRSARPRRDRAHGRSAG